MKKGKKHPKAQHSLPTSLTPKAWNYQLAIYQFFSGIPEIACIDGLRFEKSTSTRILFHIHNAANMTYGHNYSLAVFVRKKDHSVEIYDEKTGEIITEKMLNRFKKDAEFPY